jgi:type IV fimbrial biogenesis protein FimT
MAIRQSASTPGAFHELRSAQLRPLRPFAGRRQSAGFNLLELMTAVTIGAILMGMGVSSYRYVTNANRVSTEVNTLLGDLMLARSEAIKEGVNVVTCPSTNGTACSAVNTWQNGWMVFSNVAGDGVYSSTTDVVIRVQKAFNYSTTDTFTSDNAMQSVTFNREGFAINQPTTTNNYVTVTLHTSPTNNQWTRCLQIGTFGNLVTERYQASGSCQ